MKGKKWKKKYLDKKNKPISRHKEIKIKGRKISQSNNN